MALLEHRFRTALLERSPRGVDVTPAGAALLPHARALLIEVNQMQAEMRDHANGQKGALRILANTSVMTDSLPGDLATFSRANPDVRLVVEERWSDEIVRGVQAAEADIGIVVSDSPIDGLISQPYCIDRLAVVMRNDHPLAGLEELSFNHVLEEEIITLESGSSMTRLIAAQAVIAERTLQMRVQVRSFETICRMVDAGLGIGLLPSQAAQVLSKGLGLTVRTLDEEWACREMLLVFKPERAVQPSVARLLGFLRQRSAQTRDKRPVCDKAEAL